MCQGFPFKANFEKWTSTQRISENEKLRLLSLRMRDEARRVLRGIAVKSFSTLAEGLDAFELRFVGAPGSEEVKHLYASHRQGSKTKKVADYARELRIAQESVPRRP